mmetsp:Transcript_88144/g.247946  ORF Transcript_88144/g.247946 Transcript_88144/m.247946 type:complete len:223 (-) Transcript_88144:1530-2198(-)
MLADPTLCCGHFLLGSSLHGNLPLLPLPAVGRLMAFELVAGEAEASPTAALRHAGDELRVCRGPERDRTAAPRAWAPRCCFVVVDEDLSSQSLQPGHKRLAITTLIQLLEGAGHECVRDGKLTARPRADEAHHIALLDAGPYVSQKAGTTSGMSTCKAALPHGLHADNASLRLRCRVVASVSRHVVGLTRDRDACEACSIERGPWVCCVCLLCARDLEVVVS